jgi:hypothetical protein
MTFEDVKKRRAPKSDPAAVAPANAAPAAPVERPPAPDLYRDVSPAGVANVVAQGLGLNNPPAPSRPAPPSIYRDVSLGGMGKVVEQGADLVGRGAGAVAAGAQGAVESVGRGLAQQGQAIGAIPGMVGQANQYLAQGDPVKDVVTGVAGGVGKAAGIVSDFMKTSANQARTSDNGSEAVPVMPAPVVAGPAQSVGAPAAAPATQAPAASPVVSAPPVVAAAPAVAPAAAPQAMPKSIGDVAPGTGMVRNNSTGQTTAIGSPQQPGAAGGPGAQQITRNVVYDFGTPSSRARDFSVSEHDRLMGKADGGIGEGIVARGMMNKAKAFGDIAAGESAAETARRNAETQAREAASRDAERQSHEQDRQTKRADEDKVRKARDEYLALDDKSDPDGKKRAALKSKLETLTGKDGDRYTPTYNVDPMTGEKTPAGSFDTRSGQHIGLDGKPAQPKPQYTVGQVYQDGGGNKAKWDGTKFVAL